MTSDRLHAKYHVERTDGRDRPGGDKADAAYFVLDYVHDRYARTALAAYADACEAELPGLATDLRARLAAGTEVVHLIRDGSAATSCCRRAPFELAARDGHRLTVEPNAVTCGIADERKLACGPDCPPPPGHGER